MKTKLKVDILKNGPHSDIILRMVGNHNAGKVEIELHTIKGYILAMGAAYPSLHDKDHIKIECMNGGVENMMYVSDNDGEDYYLTIIEEQI